MADRSYRDVLGRLMEDSAGSRIVLFGSVLEEEMVRGMAEARPRVTVAAGKTSVKQAAALIERCDLLVCNDSGLMHAAVAVGTPVVAIYGPTDYRRTAPLGAIHRMIGTSFRAVLASSSTATSKCTFRITTVDDDRRGRSI